MPDRHTQGDDGTGSTDEDLTFTRRTALALMGVGGAAATASGSVAASHGATSSGSSGGSEPWYDWEADVDAGDYDLENLHSVETDHVYAAARDADVVVWKDADGNWHADGRDGPVATTDDVMLTTKAAIDSLTDGRTWKEKVAIVSPATVGPHAWGDGPWPGYKEIRVPSNTILDVPVPIRIEDADEPLIRAVYTNGAENVEFPNLNIKGNPRYAVWLQDTDNVRIGTVNIEMDADQEPRGGLGVRIDSGCTNVQVDTAYIKEAGWQAFETYDVTRLQVGQVLVERTPGAGVLLNDTHDATVGAVVGLEVNPGGGYSTFRVANGCTDVTCGQVVGRDGGRGFFAVSGNENVTVNALNVVGMSSHGVLIQDSQNVSVNGGVVKNSGAEGVRIDSRSAGGIPEDPRDFAATDGNVVENLRIVDTRDDPQMSWGILETGPDTQNSRIVNNDVRGSGVDGAIQIFSPDSRVVGNVGGGVAVGTATLTSGDDTAARVEGVSEHLDAALEVRSSAASDPGAAFAYDADVEWSGSAWDVVFTWDTDPGTDLDVDYIVDQEQATGFTGGVPEDGDGGSQALTEGTYRIEAVHSGKVAEVADGSTAEDANVQQWSWNDEPSQKWEAVNLHDDVFKLENVNSGLVAEVADGSTSDGANVRQGTFADEDWQKWRIQPADAGGYKVIAVHSDQGMNVSGEDTVDGANILQWPYGGGANARWRFKSL